MNKLLKKMFIGVAAIALISITASAKDIDYENAIVSGTATAAILYGTTSHSASANAGGLAAIATYAIADATDMKSIHVAKEPTFIEKGLTHKLARSAGGLGEIAGAGIGLTFGILANVLTFGQTDATILGTTKKVALGVGSGVDAMANTSMSVPIAAVTGNKNKVF